MGWPCKKCGNEEVSVCMNCDSSGMDACDVVKCICCWQVSRDIVNHHCVTCRMLTERGNRIDALEKAVKVLARELSYRRATTDPAPTQWRYEMESDVIASAAMREASR